MPGRVQDRSTSQPSDACNSDGLRFDDAALDDSNLTHFTSCVARALPETRSRAAEIKVDLKRAGNHDPFASQKLAAFRYGGMMASLIVFGTLAIYASKSVEPWCVAGIIVGMFTSWWLPVWRLKRRAARRLAQIAQAIPDAADLIDVCLSHGLTPYAALSTVGRELGLIYPSLADELAIVCRQAELDALEPALEDFERRIDLAETRELVSRLLNAEQFGTLPTATR
jgi:tight adherence protein C